MCQNTIQSPLGYKTILSVGDCLKMSDPEFPGQTTYAEFSVGDHEVHVSVPHDVNIPSGIHITVYHRGFRVW